MPEIPLTPPDGLDDSKLKLTTTSVFENAPREMQLVNKPVPFEISIQLDNLDSEDNAIYWAFDKEEAQILMEIMRDHYKSVERACQIKWRNWAKVNEKTGEPVWVMFPW